MTVSEKSVKNLGPESVEVKHFVRVIYREG